MGTCVYIYIRIYEVISGILGHMHTHIDIYIYEIYRICWDILGFRVIQENQKKHEMDTVITKRGSGFSGKGFGGLGSGGWASGRKV